MRRFFFCHLQKTGGSSLIRRLRRQFPGERIYPGAVDDPASVISVPRLLQRCREANGSIQLIAGHFPLCTHELVGGPFATFTILRDPIERTLSFIRFHRLRTPASRDRRDEEVYEDAFRFNGLIHNHMVKMLSLTTGEMTSGMLTRVEFTRERLARAKAALARIDLFGVQEEFDRFCDALQERFGFELGPPIFRNRTEPAPVSPEFRERIARDNALDVELYQWARERLDARAA